MIIFNMINSIIYLHIVSIIIDCINIQDTFILCINVINNLHLVLNNDMGTNFLQNKNGVAFIFLFKYANVYYHEVCQIKFSCQILYGL